jgi:hypothetical protein
MQPFAKVLIGVAVLLLLTLGLRGWILIAVGTLVLLAGASSRPRKEILWFVTLILCSVAVVELVMGLMMT